MSRNAFSSIMKNKHKYTECKAIWKIGNAYGDEFCDGFSRIPVYNKTYTQLRKKCYRVSQD